MAVVAIFQALSLLWWLFLILGALCALLGYILSGNKESNLHRISNALEKARKEKSTAQKALLEAIEHIGINLSKEVGLWSPEVRFTVYAHDRDNNTIETIRGSSRLFGSRTIQQSLRKTGSIILSHKDT